MTGTKGTPRRTTATAKKPAPAKAAAAPARPKKPAADSAGEKPEPVVAKAAGQAGAEVAASQESKEKPSAPVTTTMTEETAPSVAEHVIKTTEEVEQKGNEIMADVIETTKKYTEEAQVRFQSAFSEMSERAKAGVEKSTKTLEELSDIAKGNVEALVESGKIATKGVETLGQEAAEYGRVSFEKASAAMKSFAAVKSPTEFFQLQSDLISSSFDSFAKESAKASEAFLKLAGDVAQPISTRVSVMTEKVRSLTA